MGFETQRIKAPDGTEMVVLKASDFEDLLTLAEEGGDKAGALAALERIAGGEGTMPDAVLALMLDEDLSPLAAWRQYRGLSQAELARRSGLSQVWISRIEAGGGSGTAKSRGKLARALGAPAWALEPADEGAPDAAGRSPQHAYTGKYRALADWLTANGAQRITLSFDAIGRLVGGLPPSATRYQPWWQNNRGNGQALGWRTAGYRVAVDLKTRTAVFTKQA